MSKKRRSAPPPSAAKAVTLERACRLYRFLQLLDTGPKTRGAILQRLRIDIRTFYRDLELLRTCEISIQLNSRRYSLEEKTQEALLRLPCPDPNLSLGDALVLSKGRSKVHQKLKNLVSEIMC